ncbi:MULTISPECIES: DUF3899 domain-containing protein [Neobacillus]|uniref:DUF3899 domain-containing protein n=1 Tax=Neobacillus rhizophilus TaxID=2833579 RepID=A0A942YUN2_9BACI|nr:MULTISPECIES: DUF3899 domain-containing protein [Neobacillus]MBS4212145.1 DUF3899 domain-containing protein [Neobacillus rhizophilus]MBU8915575.1 DUF3899 domain-containing protein [Bacillus sp. FJAT-29953]
MKIVPNKSVFLVAFTQIVIFILSFIFYGEISIVSYINISFYISLALLLSFLLIFTIQSGFYDAISKSFNFTQSLKTNKRKFEDIPGLSQLVTIDKKPFLFYAIVNGILMLIALVVYYVLLA